MVGRRKGREEAGGTFFSWARATDTRRSKPVFMGRRRRRRTELKCRYKAPSVPTIKKRWMD